MVDDEYIRRRLESDETYIVSEGNNVASGGTFNIHIRNPEGSGVALLLHQINVSTKNGATVRTYDNFDSITDGAEVVVQNANMDSGNGAPDSGPAEVYEDSTFTPSADAEHIGWLIGSGGGGGTALGGGASLPITRIEPGRQLIIEVTNDGANPYDQQITIVFTE